MRDARNAITCAATWLAVSDGILNGNFVHSWDECGVMLNALDEKQTVKCTASGRSKLSARNLAPATTEENVEARLKYVLFLYVVILYLTSDKRKISIVCRYKYSWGARVCNCIDLRRQLYELPVFQGIDKKRYT